MQRPQKAEEQSCSPSRRQLKQGDTVEGQHSPCMLHLPESSWQQLRMLAMLTRSFSLPAAAGPPWPPWPAAGSSRRTVAAAEQQCCRQRGSTCASSDRTVGGADSACGCRAACPREGR